VSEEPVLAQPRHEDIRTELLDLVVADLHGPLSGPDEEFPVARENPIDRYPLGRLAPAGETVAPETQDELSEAGEENTEDGRAEPSAPNQPSLHPSAIGFSATVAGDVDRLLVTATWARYEPADSENEEQARRGRVWRREQLDGRATVPLVDGLLERVTLTEKQREVIVRGRARRYEGNWLVTLFLENAQRAAPGERNAAKWIFQVELSAAGPDGTLAFLASRDRISGGDETDQREQRQLAMTYRWHREFAVGCGTAVRVDGTVDQLAGRAERITTTAIGRYEVPTTTVPTARDDPDLPELADVELGMGRLADLADDPAADLESALRPLAAGYRAWIDRQTSRVDHPDAGLTGYADQARQVIRLATRAADRIEAGIRTLRADPLARQAFGFANRAMHLQRVHTMVAAERRRDAALGFGDAVAAVEQDAARTPRWRPFQLAFVLLNLPALADPRHEERSEHPGRALADLLWFPTGGGKTEAYLGLTAFTIAIRRLQRDLGGLDATDGTAVLMRYTLRLLTIQQFERATTLICAAEALRRSDPSTWGNRPIRIGLWVGGHVTPNTTEQAEQWVKAARRTRAPRGVGSPHQLSSCPWCGTPIDKGRDIEVNPTYDRTLVTCTEPTCPFGQLAAQTANLDRDRYGLPVLVVDEEIYRYPPALLIGTVDKFAQLPWRGEAASLFGQVNRWCGRHGYLSQDAQAGHETTHRAKPDGPAARTVAAKRLRPPDLIIQDELHLISGPLGSLVGLYETAVDKLATWEHDVARRSVRPKVVASTATVRRASPQIGALFYRATEVFPPPGLDVDDNFFARQRPTSRVPGRRYVGICAHGSRIRSTLIRVYVSVLGAAQKLHERYGRNPVTDPYLTLVGYFNSLRDLGAMRRLVEDDVSTRLTRARERGLANRYVVRHDELTSRKSSEQIRPLLDRLAVEFPGRRHGPDGGQQPLDVLLATNMIAVGVDVSRLGLMVVTNQPKSTAEYIQATSRVGRQYPGLVFTVYNWARPRDLSAYEHFEHFHATVYRQVEALSVTPFADRAIDRGLFGVLVSLVRQSELTYNANLAARNFDRTSPLADHVVRHLQRRAGGMYDRERDTASRVVTELDDRLNYWDRQRNVLAQQLGYRRQPKRPDVSALLVHPESGPWRRSTCLRSLRDVEPAVPLLMRRPPDAADTPVEPPWVPYQPPTVADKDAGDAS
jgi:hypothetical protein